MAQGRRSRTFFCSRRRSFPWRRCRRRRRPGPSIRPCGDGPGRGRTSWTETATRGQLCSTQPATVTAPGDGVVQRGDREAGLHPGVDGVAHDPVGVHVLDRAQVELALTGLVFGDVGQPQLVWRLGGEVALDQVVVDRRTGLAVLAALLAERAPPAVAGADPPCGPLGHRLPASRASSARNR